MPGSRRRRFVALVDLLAQHHPDIDVTAIEEMRVLVDGRFVTNPHARVPAGTSLRVVRARRLRGDVKLSHALDSFKVRVAGRVALDIGTSAGGFTTALLDRGARRIYAVDVGVGQLVGRLRVEPRVVNLEGHNLGVLNRALIPNAVGVVTMDLSYLPARDPLRQLTALEFEQIADLVVLVKPTFELRAATLVKDRRRVLHAVESVMQTMTVLGWHPCGRCQAPATGRRGAHEVFVHGQRSFPGEPWSC